MRSSWAKAIAENMEMEEWVYLGLDHNDIWDRWAEAISHMELKKWVYLNLSGNKIWDKWAEIIMNNMKLNEWITLNLRWNSKISSAMERKLTAWAQSCNAVVEVWF